MHLVIVGNGVAGIEAALTVRERDRDCKITVVSEESDHFFSRTALMWVCSGQMNHQAIEPYERDLYARMGFDRVRARAIGVDAERHELQLAGELPSLAFDKLLIASGSRPRPGPWPGSDLRGVGSFVTLQDLEWLEIELGGKARSDRPPRARQHLDATTEDSPYRPRDSAFAARGTTAAKPIVIGGGLIGIEAVEVMVAAGLKPTFFIREEWFWPIALDGVESQFIAEQMRAHGVDVRLETNVERLEGNAEGCLQAVVAGGERLVSDLAVVAIGVIPNTAWLSDSSIEMDRGGGILVNTAFETSLPNIYAVGDCASVEWWNGMRRPEQLWYTSRDQGRLAGRRILGDAVQYARGVWYNSAKLMDIEYTTAGYVNMNLDGEQNWFFQEDGAVRSTTRLTTVRDQVVGFNMLGRRWDHSVLLRFIEERRGLDWVIQHLHEAAFDTEFVPKLKLPSDKAGFRSQGVAPSKAGSPSPLPSFLQ